MTGEDAGTIALLRRRLAEATEQRRGRERELADLAARAQAAEAQVGTIRLTLAYGLGQALVDARGWAGLLRLPRRLIELHRAQKAKRRWKGAKPGGARAADQTRLLDEARRINAGEGLDAAARWIGGQPAALRTAKARALAEIAIEHVRDRPESALSIGLEAATLAPGEGRLAVLAARLHAAGHVGLPLRLYDAIAGAGLPEPHGRRRLAIVEEARIAADGMAVPPRGARASGRGVVIVASGALPWFHDAAARRAEAIWQAAGPDAFVVALDIGGSTNEMADEARRYRLAGTADEVGRALADLLRHREIGIVHLLAGDEERDALAMRVARAQGAMLVTDHAEFDPLAFDGQSERGIVARRRLAGLVAGADRVILRHEAGATLLPEAERLPAILPVFEPPAEEAVAALRRELGLGPVSRPLACFSAFDGEDGGANALVSGFAELLSEQADVVLIACGSGPGVATMMRQAARLGVADHVVHAAGLPAFRLPALVALAEAVLLPDEGDMALAREASGAGALAIAIGKPVLASARAWTWTGAPGEAAGLPDKAGMARVLAGEAPPPLPGDPSADAAIRTIHDELRAR